MPGRRGRFVPALMAIVTVLLPAGVLAAVTEGAPAPGAADERVKAAGLGHSDVLEEVTVSQTAASTSPTLPAASPTVARATGATTVPPTTRSTVKPSTTPTLPPGAPPPGPSAPGIPNVAPQSSWSGANDGVTARMRIEPAAPVAGQAVRFQLDVSSAEPCCIILLDFGDGTGFSQNPDGASCHLMSPGAHSTVASHTYASPGAYKASLTVITSKPCDRGLDPSGNPSLPNSHSVTISACIAVGPGASGSAGCSPSPSFG